MKRLSLFAALAAILSITSFSFAAEITNPGEDEGYTYMTVKEIKDLYGVENVQIAEGLNLLDTDVIAVSKKPCNGESPCGGALAQARHDAQQIANECCCIQGFGVICCQPSSGALLAIDGFVLPQGCN